MVVGALNFTPKLPLHVGLQSDVQAEKNSPLHHDHADTIAIPSAYLLFSGDYSRSGADLILSKDGHELVVPDYFRGEKRASLASPDGALLSGDLVNSLTGHVQYAQAAGVTADIGKVIGHVTKLTGSATAVRNGVSITLNMGDNCNKGDVVQCGSDGTLGITFIDGTVFGLSSNARMVLNEMVYDPNGSSNSSLLSLVQGTITFVAGETAKNGDMKVDTPVATVGIRGTAVLIEIGFEVPCPTDPSDPTYLSCVAPPVKFSVLREPDGHIGSYVLFSKTTGAEIGRVDQPGQVFSVTSTGNVSAATAQPLSTEAKAIVDQTLQTYFPNYTPPPADNKPNANPQSNPSGGGSSTPPPDAKPGDTSPIKDVPIGTPTIVPIPINLPAPALDNTTAIKTVSAPVTTTLASTPTVLINTASHTTNQTTQTISGTVDVAYVGTTVTLFDNGSTTPLATTVVGNGGLWSTSVTLSGDGPHSIVAMDTNTAGNSSASAPVLFTLDTTAPMVAINGAGGPTNQANVTLTGTVDVADAGANVTVLDGATPIGSAIVQSDGSWSSNVTLNTGSNSLTAQVTDAAGNIGTSSALIYTLNTTAPTGGTPALVAASDSGSSNADNITDVTAPTFTVALGATVLPGDTVELLLGGAPLAHPVTHIITTADVTAGSVSLSVVAGDLGVDGIKLVSVQLSDAFGNSSTTASQAITIDTTAPAEALAITAIASDSGTVGDFITNDTTLIVSGSNGALAAGEKIQVSSNGGTTWTDVTQTTATSWSLDDTATVHGTSFTYQARIVDSAGNVGTTASQAITIVTGGPAEALAITAIASDSGTVGDFITNDTTLIVSGSNGALAAGEKIQVSSNGGTTWTDVTQTTATSWSLDDTATVHGTSFTYQARIVDSAGNVGTTASQAITIDTTAPAEALAITAIASDSGTVGDFITNDTTLIVSGSNGALAAGEKIQVSSNGGTTWTDVTQTTATSWSLDDTATVHGTSFTYQARIVDSAGNVGTTASQAITIVTRAPAEALAITAIASDSGTVGDFITNDTTLIVSGSNGALAAGEKIQVSSNGGTTWTDVTQTTATGWSLDDTATVHGTSFTYQARIVDSAGNVGTTASQAITIVTTAPAEALAITAIASDSGTVGDFITNDTTLIVSGSNGALAAGEKIQVSSNGGTTWTDVTQTTATGWSLDDTATVHGTSFTYQARIVDSAGNVGTTASQAITIDTTAPAEALAITAIASDSGTVGDFITNDTTLIVSGSNGALAAGEKIQVSSNGGTTWTDVTQTTATGWSLDDTATVHGTSFTYQARIVDSAGNVGTTASQAITIVTRAPAEALAITAIASDSGTVGDFITNDTTLIVSGSNGALAAGEKIQVSSNGGTTWTDVTQTTATGWSLDDTATVHGTSFTYQARIVDSAGNVGTTASQAITIDTTAPAEALAITAIASDSGTVGDFITNDTTLIVSGSNGALAAGEKIQVSSNGGTTWTDVTQTTATGWSLDDTATVHGTSFTYQARIVDSAGNVGTTASQAITIDTTAPAEALAITAIASDSGTVGDFITNDTTLIVSGSNGALAAGEKIQVSSNGGTTWTDVTQTTATGWSLDDTATVHGTSFTYQARIVDSAGNVGTTASQAITIDTTAPAEALAITAIASDSGTVGDFITNDTTLIVSGSNGALAAGEKIQVSSNGGTTWTDVTQTTATGWSLDDTATVHGTSFTYQARIVDSAGNVGTTASQAITIDTTAPAEALAITAIASDSGTVGDFITNDTTLIVSGSNGALAAGEKIQVSSNGGTTWTDVTQTTATGWSLDDTATVHGTSFTYQARIVDSAGNVGTTASQAITIVTRRAGGGSGDHGDSQRQRHGWRLHHQRHHADRVGQQWRAGGGREDPGQQQWRHHLDRRHPDHGDGLEP